MLYLTRKKGESIVINQSITLTVLETSSTVTKLGISSPANTSILRQEVFDRILEENQIAHATTTFLQQFQKNDEKS